MSLIEKVKDNIVFVVLTTAVASFSTGFGAYKAMLEATNQTTIIKDHLDNLLKMEKELDGHCTAIDSNGSKGTIPPAICSGTHRIILYSLQGKSDQRLVDIMDKLVEQKCYAQIFGNIDSPRYNFAVSEIRWFHKEDQAFAVSVADFLRSKTGIGISTSDKRELGSRARVGQFEIWLK
jgi:hypothetical protein